MIGHEVNRGILHVRGEWNKRGNDAVVKRVNWWRGWRFNYALSWEI